MRNVYAKELGVILLHHYFRAKNSIKFVIHFLVKNFDKALQNSFYVAFTKDYLLYIECSSFGQYTRTVIAPFCFAVSSWRFKPPKLSNRSQNSQKVGLATISFLASFLVLCLPYFPTSLRNYLLAVLSKRLGCIIVQR